MKIGIVVPHIFMHRDILPHVIFSSGRQAIRLAEGLQALGVEVTLFSPGPLDCAVANVTADLTYFEDELQLRGDGYVELLKKHPLTFITLARQAQSELIAKAYAMANDNSLDLVHVYTNEEELALTFASFCRKPVVFTHHDPFNFLVRYKSIFPKYPHLKWLSLSLAQRRAMPRSTNWAGNIYHGLPTDTFRAEKRPREYFAYLGRIIQPKGVHLAIQAVKKYNRLSGTKHPLRIAGKHYAGHSKDNYWIEKIKPSIDNKEIIYEGFIANDSEKQHFLSGAKALLVPSLFEEPFGMVMIEALACGTPLIGLASGAIPEVIKEGQTGAVIKKTFIIQEDQRRALDQKAVVGQFVEALQKINDIRSKDCRADFEKRFTLERMCQQHLRVYRSLAANDS